MLVFLIKMMKIFVFIWTTSYIQRNLKSNKSCYQNWLVCCDLWYAITSYCPSAIVQIFNNYFKPAHIGVTIADGYQHYSVNWLCNHYVHIWTVIVSNQSLTCYTCTAAYSENHCAVCSSTFLECFALNYPPYFWVHFWSINIFFGTGYLSATSNRFFPSICTFNSFWAIKSCKICEPTASSYDSATALSWNSLITYLNDCNQPDVSIVSPFQDLSSTNRQLITVNSLQIPPSIITAICSAEL